ncbi:hypothetical protein F5I97DRAFT_1850356 [Phlebopus sp. FC_14]|nr:hypothetical protein F5I97DRAFT_1850356 [Phlebopus sp. FC_14]
MVFGLPPEEPEKRIFIKDGRPVRFFFHQSVRQGIDKLTRDIEEYGGEITEEKPEADVLLVDEEVDIELIRRRYYSSTDLFRIRMIVEPRGFIRKCIRSGVYEHRAPKQTGMPGPRPGGGGRVRHNFTPEDDEHLAYYLATIFPDPSTGGRLGNVHYKNLMDLSCYPDFHWARRHTWHSWRERYKMQRTRLDPMIEKYVQQLKHIGHTFGHDPRSRQYERFHQVEEDEEDEEEEEGDGQQQEDEQLNKGWPPAEERDVNDAARNYLAEHEHNLIAFDDHNDPRGNEGVVQQPRKRQRMQSGTPRGSSVQESPAKRARVGAAASPLDQGRRESAVEQGRPQSGRSSPDMGFKDTHPDDLFGDYEFGEYQEELDHNFEKLPDVEHSPLRSPQASPAEPDDPGLRATERTLVGSPIARDKAARPASRAETQAGQERSWQLPLQNIPSSSQMTLVAGHEVTTAERDEGITTESSHVPQVKDKVATTRTQIATLNTDAPYRNTRARSRSVEPQAEIVQEARKSKGKGKARMVELEADPEDSDQRPENEGAVIPVASSSGLPLAGTLDDEMAVENLLDPSADESDASAEGIPRFQEIVEVEDGSGDDEEKDEYLPRYQDVGSDEPSDSDDAETHHALRQPPRPRDADGDSPSDRSKDEDEDEDERLQRLANASLRRVPATTSRGTGAAATPARPHTRSRAREPTFPSPGTRAREVVDRINQEKMKLPYTPPPGSRAAARRTMGKV